MKRLEILFDMKKKSPVKRILKIVFGIVIFLTLPSLLFFGFIYIKYNEELPQGELGSEADELAKNMLIALDYKAYEATSYLEWTFKGAHSYKWDKTENQCEVKWKDFKVELNLNNPENSTVYVINQKYDGIDRQKLITKAKNYFNNDSFWLVAPYKIFDRGTERRLVETEDGKKALLVTYTSGGTTPGDSYLWHLDDNFKPMSYQMWINILPIGGLEATWENWITTESGAQLPTFHKLLFLGLEITDIQGYIN